MTRTWKKHGHGACRSVVMQVWCVIYVVHEVVVSRLCSVIGPGLVHATRVMACQCRKALYVLFQVVGDLYLVEQ